MWVRWMGIEKVGVVLRQVAYLEFCLLVWPMVEQDPSPRVVCLDMVMRIGEVVGGRWVGH